MAGPRALRSGLLIPVLFLIPLVLITNGAALVMYAMLPFFFLICSVIVLGVNLASGERRWERIGAPVICSAVCGLVLIYVVAVLQIAKSEFRRLAAEMQEACEILRRCPEHPPGWQAKSWAKFKYRSQVGAWVIVPVSYVSSGDSFAMHFHVGPDVGETLEGGVGRDVTRVKW